jgi:hypothetical protein
LEGNFQCQAVHIEGTRMIQERADGGSREEIQLDSLFDLAKCRVPFGEWAYVRWKSLASLGWKAGSKEDSRFVHWRIGSTVGCQKWSMLSLWFDGLGYEIFRPQLLSIKGLNNS